MLLNASTAIEGFSGTGGANCFSGAPGANGASALAGAAAPGCSDVDPHRLGDVLELHMTEIADAKDITNNKCYDLIAFGA